MQEKRKVFLLNDEQRILVFLSFGRRNYVPKIIVPSLEMPFFEAIQILNVEDMEYITEISKIKEHFEATNNRLKKVSDIKKYIYYAITINLSKEMQNEINKFCFPLNFVADFMTIEEIQNVLTYIKENYAGVKSQKTLSEPLKVLKRKLYYEEY